MKRLSIYISLFICTVMLLVSCSQDEPQQPARVAFSIASLPASSVGTPASPTSDVEKIQSWWVVFVTDDGIVSEIIRRNPTLTSAVESEEITAEIRPGHYTVYAFANISEQELLDATGLSFQVGEAAPDNIANAVWQDFPICWDAEHSADTPVPMSGTQSVTVTNHVNPDFSIEVIRMTAKVEFVFKNDAESDIEVLGVEFGPLYSGEMPLFAAVDLPANPPLIIEGTTQENTIRTFPASDNRLLPQGSSAVYSPHIYLRESSALTHPTGHFHIGVRIKRADFPEETIYALTSDISWLNRNDWLRIPVTFTDWSLECMVSFYPPIGGYPAWTVEEKNHEYFVTFKSGGDFTILPRIKNGSTNAYIGIDKTTVTCTVESDPDRILAKTPQFDAVTHELMGALRDGSETETVKGTAVINLDIQVKADTNTSHIFRRKIYIVKQ